MLRTGEERILCLLLVQGSVVGQLYFWASTVVYVSSLEARETEIEASQQAILVKQEAENNN
jgi:hypothetical protein